MTLKLLHTADVQLDAPFGFLGILGARHRQQLKDTFTKIINLAKNNSYQMMLIAGDLFNDNQPARETVQFVARQLASLPIPVCILPGNHDYYDAQSIYRRTIFPSNVHILTKQPTFLDFPDLDLTIAGNPLTSRFDSTSPLRGLKRTNKRRWFVALAHGNLQISNIISIERPIQTQEIAACGADYVALGDWHAFNDYSQGDVKAFYAGAPEPTALSQSGAGYVVSITLSEKGVAVKPVPVGTVKAKSDTFDITGLSENKLIKRLQGEANPNLMRRLTLTGLKQVDQFFDLNNVLDAVQNDYYFLQLLDESITALNEIDPDTYPETHVIGQYLRLAQSEINQAETDQERHIIAQALQLGVALLNGEEVLR